MPTFRHILSDMFSGLSGGWSSVWNGTAHVCVQSSGTYNRRALARFLRIILKPLDGWRINLVKNSLIKMLKPLSVSFNWQTTLSCTFSLVLWGNSSGLLNIKTFKLNCLIIYGKKSFKVLSTFPINISVVISQIFKSLSQRTFFGMNDSFIFYCQDEKK